MKNLKNNLGRILTFLGVFGLIGFSAFLVWLHMNVRIEARALVGFVIGLFIVRKQLVDWKSFFQIFAISLLGMGLGSTLLNTDFGFILMYLFFLIGMGVFSLGKFKMEVDEFEIVFQAFVVISFSYFIEYSYGLYIFFLMPIYLAWLWYKIKGRKTEDVNFALIPITIFTYGGIIYAISGNLGDTYDGFLDWAMIVWFAYYIPRILMFMANLLFQKYHKGLIDIKINSVEAKRQKLKSYGAATALMALLFIVFKQENTMNIFLNFVLIVPFIANLLDRYFKYK